MRFHGRPSLRSVGPCCSPARLAALGRRPRIPHRRDAALALALLLAVLGLAAPARADGSLAMDEPKSGLHLDVEGACQVRPADGGGAACQSYAASADKSDVFAVVLNDAGLFGYSVAMFAEREPGAGEERARRVSKSMGESVAAVPSPVTFGGQAFLRTRLEMANGAAICFITADDRAEVAVIMFATDRDALSSVEPKAEAAMRTLRRAGAPPPSAWNDGTAPPKPMSRTVQMLITAFLALVFGLPVIRFIQRAVRTARKGKR
jgi:hypothetical protein